MSPATNNTYTQSRPARRSRLFELALLAGLIAAMTALVMNQQRIVDYIKLRNYQPANSVVALATSTTLTPAGIHLFYINKPQVLATVGSFRQYCTENEDTIVLGCYHSGQNGIYVYDVPDPALMGVQQVTAAHEVLHAGYERLSQKQRAKLDAMLNNYYQNGLTDQDVKDQIAIYKKTEPTAINDEMNSLFGTEIAKLSPELEAHYSQYFSDRSRVIGYYAAYQGQFKQRQASITSFDSQLNTLKSSIDNQQISIDTQIKSISVDRSRINGYKSSNQIAEYNAAVPLFNAKIDGYNSAVVRLQASVAQYNQLVTERNQIAGQLKVLDKALDTRTVQSIAN